MSETRALLVDAFTDSPCTGNAAGVVPDADDLTEDQMQAIATELGASETAFIQESDTADRRIRFFTPTMEVDLCGHATIASHAHLFSDGVLVEGKHTMETNVGDLPIELESDGTVWMTQNEPDIREVDLTYTEIGDAIGIETPALRGASDDLPLVVADTGLPFLVVPVTYLSDLSGATPDFDAIETLTETLDVAGLYVFSFDTLDRKSTLHGRMWAPGAGVDEDPVTGTASGAVGTYLDKYEAFGVDEMPDEMIFEQGHFVDRPGRVKVRTTDSDAPTIGGRAVGTLDGTLSVPVSNTDEILEG